MASEGRGQQAVLGFGIKGKTCMHGMLTLKPGAGEMARPSRAITALAKDMGPVSSTYRMLHNCR